VYGLDAGGEFTRRVCHTKWEQESEEVYLTMPVTLPDFDWHDFGTHSGRKTIVTQIVSDTGDITAVQHYIGHASSAMTDKHNRADPRKQREIGLKSARKQWARSAA
jgi:hypothetical protein